MSDMLIIVVFAVRGNLVCVVELSSLPTVGLLLDHEWSQRGVRQLAR
jgi:hypothetical protein